MSVDLGVGREIYRDSDGRTVEAFDDDRYIARSDNTSPVIIPFQTGYAPKCGVNGLYNEQLLMIVMDRLQLLEAKMPHHTNVLAIGTLKQTLRLLESRYTERTANGTIGTDNP